MAPVAIWDAVGEKIADRWTAVTASAVVFWAGALGAWAFDQSDWGWVLQQVERFNRQSAIVQLALLLGMLIGATATALVVERLTLPVLRLLEGYWPSWFDGIARTYRRRMRRRKILDAESSQVIYRQRRELLENLGPDPEPDSPRTKELYDRYYRLSAQYARLEHRRQHRPVLDSELLPTRVGNILRAAESRPKHRYGINTVVIWPRMLLVLPEQARKEIAEARSALNTAVAAVIWGIAFTVFTPWAWWAAPLGLFVAVLAVLYWVPFRAEQFGDLLEAVFDMYRFSLYEQARWPLPASPAEEPGAGRALTAYLHRGSDDPNPKFTHPPSPGKK